MKFKFLRGWQLWAGAGCVVLVLGWILFVPGEPHGRYASPGIGCIGTAYFEFKDGTMSLMVPETSPQIWGKYRKNGSRWELVVDGKDIYVLRATFFSLTIRDSEGKQVWETCPRFFWFSK